MLLIDKKVERMGSTDISGVNDWILICITVISCIDFNSSRPNDAYVHQ